MSGKWSSSTRRSELPADWPAIRAAVARRARGQCEHAHDDGTRCSEQGTECDHINGRNNHTLTNLQWLCHQHHAEKTQREAREAAAIAQAKLTHPSLTKRHPGLL